MAELNHNDTHFIHSNLGQIFYICIQLTWGFFQSLLGFILLLIFYKSPHDMYYGSIRTKWPLRGGISLGLFIFTPNEQNMSSVSPIYSKERWNDYCAQVSVHEYGHTVQSLILGPLYLVTVGIVSLIWSRSGYFKQKRKENCIPYSDCWTEKWANSLGEKVLKEPSIHH
ncbi:MAG: hypothetical protein JJU01_00475 [Alkalibacterium sp.]|nr:hypothetical protein [Alkalibacterium sp.]